MLDTNVAINLRDSHGTTINDIAALGKIPYLSVVTKIELEGGVCANPELTILRRRAVDALLFHLPIVDFDDHMATVYGQIVAQAGFSRRKIINRMVAATAIVQDLTLITTNGEDFADIKGLKLMVWPVTVLDL